MKYLKKIIQYFIGRKNFESLKRYKFNFLNSIFLVQNYWYDYKKYKNNSVLFNSNTFSQKECLIILKYHSIEKGLLHKHIKPFFGKSLIVDLIQLLKNNEIIARYRKSQINAALVVMCEYYEVHKSMNIDITSYFSNDDYIFFKNNVYNKYESTIFETKENFYSQSNNDFSIFSKSRASIRSFTGEKVDKDTVIKIIELSKNAPSVCNRQAIRIHYFDDKITIDKILDIQQGLKGYTKNISQLFVLSVDVQYFYSVGERYQFYIDGGIYLMNLLYAIHFYKIAACPAHFAHSFELEKKMYEVANISNNEKIICIVPFGIASDEFKRTLSLRREVDEFFKIH